MSMEVLHNEHNLDKLELFQIIKDLQKRYNEVQSTQNQSMNEIQRLEIENIEFKKKSLGYEEITCERLTKQLY